MAMTQTQDVEIRKMALRFADSLTNEEMAALHSALLQLEGTTRIDYAEAQLTLEYEFPVTCRADIWAAISRLIETAHFSFIDRLAYALSAFAEQNEKDHRLYLRHWTTYAEDIHVHYFDYGHAGSSDTHKHLWRRYQLKAGD